MVDRDIYRERTFYFDTARVGQCQVESIREDVLRQASILQVAHLGRRSLPRENLNLDFVKN